MTGPGLRLAALAAAIVALAALAVLVQRTFARGRKSYLAPASGSAARGVAYAFGAGMLPGAKESASEHLPTYVTGVLYHLGILAALVSFILAVVGIGLAPAVRIPAAAILATGSLAGLALAGRRASSHRLRALSVPDDYLANLLTDCFVASALLSAVAPAATPFFLAVAIPFFLYLPLGKVRHCVFFFVSRAFFGAFQGRRGVFPPLGH
jgi:hypothetical protein